MANINFFAISSLLILILTLIVAAMSFLKGRDKKLNTVWALFCISGAIWGLGSYKFSTTLSKENALFWWQIAYLGVILSPVIFSHFIFTYLNYFKKRLLLLFYILAGLFLVCNFFTRDLFLGNLKFVFHQFYWHDWLKNRSILFLSFYLSFYWFLLPYSFFSLVKQLKHTSGSRRIQIKYLIFCGILGWLGPHGLFLIDFGFNIYPFSNLFISIFAMLISYAIIRHNLLDLNIVIQKSFVYSVLISLITATYFIFVFLAEKLFQGMVGYTSLIVSVVYAFVIALFFIPVKNRIQHLADKIFLGKDPIQIAKENELMRQELERSERLKAVAHFASGMAHEIKNPLTAIKTFAEYLPEKKNDPEFLNKFSKIVSGEVGRIDSLVHQLLDFAKPAPLNLQEIDIHSLLDDTLSLLNNDFIKHSIKVIKDYSANNRESEDANNRELIGGDSPKISENSRPQNLCLKADFNKLKQAFLNLFLNSIDAMPNGGTLTIETSVQVAKGSSDQVDLTTRPLDHSVTITITDTGCGIPEKDLPHIFEPFYSTKENGTGLGLSIVYNILKGHKGNIKVESKLREGAKFIIELPVT